MQSFGRKRRNQFWKQLEAEGMIDLDQTGEEVGELLDHEQAEMAQD